MCCELEKRQTCRLLLLKTKKARIFCIPVQCLVQAQLCQAQALFPQSIAREFRVLLLRSDVVEGSGQIAS